MKILLIDDHKLKKIGIKVLLEDDEKISVIDYFASKTEYLEKIEELVGVKISLFSTGPDRTKTNLLEYLWN